MAPSSLALACGKAGISLPLASKSKRTTTATTVRSTLTAAPTKSNGAFEADFASGLDLSEFDTASTSNTTTPLSSLTASSSSSSSSSSSQGQSAAAQLLQVKQREAHQRQQNQQQDYRLQQLAQERKEQLMLMQTQKQTINDGSSWETLVGNMHSSDAIVQNISEQQQRKRIKKKNNNNNKSMTLSSSMAKTKTTNVPLAADSPLTKLSRSNKASLSRTTPKASGKVVDAKRKKQRAKH